LGGNDSSDSVNQISGIVKQLIVIKTTAAGNPVSKLASHKVGNAMGV